MPTFTIGATNVQDGTGAAIISGQGVVGRARSDLALNGTNALSRIRFLGRDSFVQCEHGLMVRLARWGQRTHQPDTFLNFVGVSGTFSATLDPGPLSSGTKTHHRYVQRHLLRQSEAGSYHRRQKQNSNASSR